jgi:hypothetical protein
MEARALGAEEADDMNLYLPGCGKEAGSIAARNAI